MKYYQIDVSAEPKVIGVNNGIYQIEIDRNKILSDERFDQFMGFFNYKNKDFWKSQRQAMDFKIPVIEAKLLKKAKVTDMMGYTSRIKFLYKVYSSKYLEILKAFNIGNYACFEVKIENVKEKYYFIYFETILLEDIDFNESSVITGHRQHNDIKYHSVKNKAEYIDFNYNNPLGKFEIIAISKDYLGKDIICVQATSLPFYSERLVDFLLDCGITGLQIGYENSTQLKFV